jgi:hypothetical protein
MTGYIEEGCGLHWGRNSRRTETDSMNEPKPTTQEPLYGWQIEQIMPDPADETKDIRCATIVAAQRSEQVWEYLAGDRNDPRVEVVTIRRFGPIVAIFQETKP